MSNKPSVRSKWWGWGSDLIRFPLGEKPGVAIYIKEKFGKEISSASLHNWDIQKVQIPPSRISEDQVQTLETLMGKECVSTRHADRILHAAGKSYKDLVRLRSLKLDQAPDVVLYPGTEKEIADVIHFCRKNKIALIPFGAGSNVVGSLEAKPGHHQAVAVLDMSRFDRVGEVDPLSATVVVECGIYGPDLENQLGGKGWTLGHFPQSFEFSTLGGWIAMRSSGQNSILYGGVERWVSSLRIVTPAGVIETLDVPRDAAGPDLKQILIGSEGIFGVIVSAKIKLTLKPAQKDYFLFAFKNFEQSMLATRALARSKLAVAMIRVSDGVETEALFKLGSHPGLKNAITHFFLKFKNLEFGKFSAVMVGLEGSSSQCAWLRSQVEGIFSEYQGVSVGNGPGRRWLKDRFFLPYLRDELLDHGVLIETFETSAPWSRLLQLHEAVCQRVKGISKKQGASAEVFAHLSHFYPDGASIYFTVIAPQIRGEEIAQWDELKKSINDEIRIQRGAASHHHGVGTEHRGYCWSSEVEKSLLQSMKSNLDPDEIFNPGKLL